MILRANLASFNLMKFVDENGKFRCGRFHAKPWTS